MQFDTKIAVVIRTDLEAWQKLNVASFLAGGIAATFPECIGARYEDGSATLNAATRECYKYGGKECVIRAWACDAKG